MGFLEKNRDTVMEQQIEVLKRSNNPLVCELFSVIDPAKKSTPRVKVKVTTHLGNVSNFKYFKSKHEESTYHILYFYLFFRKLCRLSRTKRVWVLNFVSLWVC